MDDPRHTAGWRSLRREWAARIAAGDVHCWRCEAPILPGQPWDLGHLVDHAAGGHWRDSLPEHRRCNRGHGAATAARRRRPPTPPAVPPPW